MGAQSRLIQYWTNICPSACARVGVCRVIRTARLAGPNWARRASRSRETDYMESRAQRRPAGPPDAVVGQTTSWPDGSARPAGLRAALIALPARPPPRPFLIGPGRRGAQSIAARVAGRLWAAFERLPAGVAAVERKNSNSWLITSPSERAPSVWPAVRVGSFSRRIIAASLHLTRRAEPNES